MRGHGPGTRPRPASNACSAVVSVPSIGLIGDLRVELAHQVMHLRQFIVVGQAARKLADQFAGLVSGVSRR